MKIFGIMKLDNESGNNTMFTVCYINAPDRDSQMEEMAEIIFRRNGYSEKDLEEIISEFGSLGEGISEYELTDSIAPVEIEIKETPTFLAYGILKTHTHEDSDWIEETAAYLEEYEARIELNRLLNRSFLDRGYSPVEIDGILSSYPDFVEAAKDFELDVKYEIVPLSIVY